MPERRALLDELFPKLVAYHQWLYRERVLGDSGLVTLIHPWECGLDSTPPWMQALRRWRMPWWLRVAERLHLARVLRSLRYDTRYLPAAERATDDDGLRMLALAVHAKRYGFELHRMPRDRSVLVEDIAFNAMLAAANRSLESIAQEVSRPLPAELAQAIAQTPTAIEDLWDEEAGHYCSRNAATGQPIRQPSVATFLPLWAGSVPPERVERLVALLRRPTSYWPAFPVPSVPVDAPEFSETRYWKGPAWVNMNWAIVEGLRECGEDALAGELRRRTLALVERGGILGVLLAADGRGPRRRRILLDRRVGDRPRRRSPQVGDGELRLALLPLLARHRVANVVLPDAADLEEPGRGPFLAQAELLGDSAALRVAGDDGGLDAMEPEILEAETHHDRHTLGHETHAGVADVDPVAHEARLERPAQDAPQADLPHQRAVGQEEAEPVGGVELALTVPRAAALAECLPIHDGIGHPRLGERLPRLHPVTAADPDRPPCLPIARLERSQQDPPPTQHRFTLAPHVRPLTGGTLFICGTEPRAAR